MSVPPHQYPSTHGDFQAGPVPWTRFLPFCLVVFAVIWASAVFLRWDITLAIFVGAVIGYWALLPKDEPPCYLPGWSGWVVGVAFFGGAIAAAYTSEIEEHLIGPAGALWVIGLVQLTLWLRQRFGYLVDPIAPVSGWQQPH